MFDRSNLSLVPEVVILVGVVLLVTSVFHALLVWFATAALVAGVLSLLVACLRDWFWSDSRAGFAAPPTTEPHKEG